MSGHNTSLEAGSSHMAEGSHDKAEEGDNQSVMSSDAASERLYPSEYDPSHEVGFDKLTLSIRNLRTCS